MAGSTIKEEARRIVDRLPDDAPWEHLQYQINLRVAAEAGVREATEREAASPPLQPRDEWERTLLKAASNCGVSLPLSAMTSEEMYE